MLLEKKEIFVGLNGSNKIGKENGLWSGLYSSPNPLPQQRRKSGELSRRSSSRRRPSFLALLLFTGLIFVVGFIFVAFQHHPSPSSHVPEKIGDGNALEDEVLSRDSLPRQLGDQMTLCKSYAVIAKENNNLPLAWHLSAQIRAAQELLSLGATRGTPVTWDEAEPIMREMSSLIFKAKELHYDSATMLMRLKAEMQALEEMANTAATQSATFGQLAAEAVPKSLHCLSLRLATQWATDEKLREHVAAVQKKLCSCTHQY